MVLIVLDFRFVGGTIGAVVGEKVSLAFELATRRKLPVVAVVTSGTTGIQEGVISLMQMAKASFALNSLGEEGLPFITVMANPTTGQVYSSFATLADVILAELGISPGPRACAVVLGRLPGPRRLRHSQRRGAPGPRYDRPDNRQGEAERPAFGAP